MQYSENAFMFGLIESNHENATLIIVIRVF
jgi:hypothetical protein